MYLLEKDKTYIAFIGNIRYSQCKVQLTPYMLAVVQDMKIEGHTTRCRNPKVMNKIS